jgi:hypothetical protein
MLFIFFNEVGFDHFLDHFLYILFAQLFPMILDEVLFVEFFGVDLVISGVVTH